MKALKGLLIAAGFVALISILLNCGATKIEYIPDFMQGTWSNPVESHVRTLHVHGGDISIVNEYGEAKTCSVSGAIIYHPVFGDRKTTILSCDTDTPTALSFAKHCKKYPRPFSWEIHVIQDDSEDDSHIDAMEYIDLHCEEGSKRILGEFYKDQ